MQANPLVDSFGRVHTYLRVSVTDRCNLRCSYCAPPHDIQWKTRSDILTFEEILRISKLLVSRGVVKIRLTGGEPTVRKNIEWLIEQLAILPGLSTVAMTTNGLLLKEKAYALKASGLTSLNVSLDTLREDRFRMITSRDRFREVLAGIEASLANGFRPLKLNTVIMAGVNDDELIDFIEFVKDKPINVRFIEFMPSRGTWWQQDRIVSFLEMKRRIEFIYPLKPIEHDDCPNEMDPRSVARDYSVEGFIGSVSFITPMTRQFCNCCSRLRLTADGSIKTCLFSPAEVDLRAAIRQGAEDQALADLIQNALEFKKERPGLSECSTLWANHAMYAIGG